MTNYNLALDAGGSKVTAILYDDQFRLLSAHRTGSLRSNTTSEELVTQNIRSLLTEMEIAGKTISTVIGISDASLLHALRDICRVEQHLPLGELGLGLAAAELFGDGLLALSGTGATMYARCGEKRYATGGYGAAVYDAGSGYHIGREAFRAAIEDDEERGPRTLLTDLIAQKLGGARASFSRNVFALYEQSTISPTAYVASCTPLVSEAAFAGDAAAMRILEDAGMLLGTQLVALVKKHRLPRSLPVTISGSVWRSHPVLFDSFRDTLAESGMDGNLHIPAFEPIVGAIIAHYHRVHGAFDPDARDRFLIQYEAHRFRVASDLDRRPNPQKLVPTVRADAPMKPQFSNR